jgi:prephenate dehydrogenase
LAAPEAWLTDVGSTKQTIVEAVHSFGLQDRFIGSHPMAGSDKSGVQFADRDLFREKMVILTPTESSHPDTRKTLESFWQLLGARTLCLDPAEHDRAVAQVSHLPHVIAAVLSRMTDRDLLPVAASGWASTTRVAAGDPELWRQILHENRHAIRESMRRFIDEWSLWEQTIESGDDAQLLLLLQEAQRIRSLSQFR